MSVLTRFLFIVLIILANLSIARAETVSLVRIHPETREQAACINGLDYPETMHRRPSDYVDLLVPVSEIPQVAQCGAPIEIIYDDIEATARERFASRNDMGNYHTYTEVVDEINAVHTAFPEITDLISIGQTWQNREIWALKISDNVLVDEDEPEMLVVCLHHAREIITPEIALDMIHYLTQNYAINDSVSYLVNNREFWVIPMLNPDGHNVVAEIYNYWRKNVRDNNNNGLFDTGYDGVDPNRNYGFMWGYDNSGSSPSPSSDNYRGPSAFSEPETQAIRDFAESHNLQVTLNFHSYGEVIYFPWGYIPAETPDHAIYLSLGQAMTEDNGYNPSSTAMGAYATNGDADDWNYGEQTTKNKIFSFTPEIGTEFLPPQSQIPVLLAEAFPIWMTAAYFSANPYGVAPPVAPTIVPIPVVNQSDFTLSWTTPEPDPNNPAVSYDVRQRTGMNTTTDTAESGADLWSTDGFYLTTVRSHSPNYSFYSGTGNHINNTLQSTAPLPVTGEMVLQFWTWYDIEDDYDYAYVKISTDGVNFDPIPGSVTTNSNPNGNNQGNGITGSSNGWVQATFDLGDFAGQSIWIQFNYWTDSYVTEAGFYVDDIYPVLSFETDEMIAANLEATSLELNDYSPDTYYFQVRARDGEDQYSVWSSMEAVPVDYAVGLEDGPYGQFTTQLEQNFPNPFNPQTAINFSLARDCRISLNVYNISGQLVKSLVNGHWSLGQHETVWDGRNALGQPVSSGVYYYRLQTDRGELLTNSMILLK